MGLAASVGYPHLPNYRWCVQTLNPNCHVISWFAAGVQFSLYCVNHLLLPMLQSWLRRGSRMHGYWDTGTVNFKQCCGLTADLVVEFISTFVSEYTVHSLVS
jgi:hypothetical protein